MDKLQEKLESMEKWNPSVIRKNKLFTRFNEYLGMIKLYLDVQSRDISRYKTNPSFLEYSEKSITEEEVKEKVQGLYEQVKKLNNEVFSTRFSLPNYKESPSGHPLIFDETNPFENSDFHYNPSSTYFNDNNSEPLNDISLFVRYLNPGFLTMQTVDDFWFKGYAVMLFSPDKKVYDEVKNKLLTYGFDECFKDIY